MLSSEFWRFRFYQSFEYEWQPTLFQPVGGMDKIVDAFVSRIGHLIQYETETVGIRTRENGVTITTQNRLGQPVRLEADYCISNIPLPLLLKINNNFSPDFYKAVATCV